MFVESVLRYGLPVNFQGMILLPQKKTQKKLRDTLNQLYAHLDSAGGSGDVSTLLAQTPKKKEILFEFFLAGNARWTGFWPIRVLSIRLLQDQH